MVLRSPVIGPFTHEVTQMLRLRNPANEAMAFKVRYGGRSSEKANICSDLYLGQNDGSKTILRQT